MNRKSMKKILKGGALLPKNSRQSASDSRHPLKRKKQNKFVLPKPNRLKADEIKKKAVQIFKAIRVTREASTKPIKKLIFMYAGHGGLIENESTLFHELGHEVVASPWISADNSILKSNPAYNEYVKSNPNPHAPFIYGNNPFNIKNRIESMFDKTELTYLQSIPHIGKTADEDTKEFLSDKFDVLYVGQVADWLMDLAPYFLKKNKQVILRTFSIPIPWVADVLSDHENFHLVAVHPKESKLYAEHHRFKYAIAYLAERFYPIKWLYDPIEDNRKLFTLSTSSKNVNEVKNRLVNKLKFHWTLANALEKFMPVDQVLYNTQTSLCYLDLVHSTCGIKYSAIESILMGTPVVCPSEKLQGGLDSYMSKYTKRSVPYAFTDYNHLEKIVSNLSQDHNLRSTLWLAQRAWLSHELENTRQVFRSLLKDSTVTEDIQISSNTASHPLVQQ